MKFRTFAATATAAVLLAATTTGCAGNLANNVSRTQPVGVTRDTYRGGTLARNAGITRDGVMRTDRITHVRDGEVRNGDVVGTQMIDNTARNAGTRIARRGTAAVHNGRGRLANNTGRLTQTNRLNGGNVGMRDNTGARGVNGRIGNAINATRDTVRNTNNFVRSTNPVANNTHRTNTHTNTSRIANNTSMLNNGMNNQGTAHYNNTTAYRNPDNFRNTVYYETNNANHLGGVIGTADGAIDNLGTVNHMGMRADARNNVRNNNIMFTQDEVNNRDNFGFNTYHNNNHNNNYNSRNNMLNNNNFATNNMTNNNAGVRTNQQRNSPAGRTMVENMRNPAVTTNERMTNNVNRTRPRNAVNTLNSNITNTNRTNMTNTSTRSANTRFNLGNNMGNDSYNDNVMPVVR
jgi:hypothetical protein